MSQNTDIKKYFFYTIIFIFIIFFIIITTQWIVPEGYWEYIYFYAIYFTNKQSFEQQESRYRKQLLNKEYRNIHDNIDESENIRPKIIWQTYHNKSKIPIDVYSNIQQYAPDYQHIILNDEEGIQFLNQFFQPKVVQAFKQLKLGAHKADLLRYALLYIYGGIYLDIKTQLIQSIDSVFPDQSVIYLIRNAYNHGMIYQGIISSPPGNPLFLSTIYFILQNLNPLYLLYCYDFWFNVKTDVPNLSASKYGHVHSRNRKRRYYFFREIFSKNPHDCSDGLDRYGLCSYAYQMTPLDSSSSLSFFVPKKVIKIRRADYPFS
jgi:hypothetical protein